MSTPSEEHSQKTQPAFSNRAPRQRKVTSQEWENQPDVSDRTVYLLDPIVVRDLASALGLKPFQVVADLIARRHFKSPDDTVDFETASVVARKHGYQATRPLPGQLVL
jgi:translation initiation factor IF-2